MCFIHRAPAFSGEMDKAMFVPQRMPRYFGYGDAGTLAQRAVLQLGGVRQQTTMLRLVDRGRSNAEILAEDAAEM